MLRTNRRRIRSSRFSRGVSNFQYKKFLLPRSVLTNSADSAVNIYYRYFSCEHRRISKRAILDDLTWSSHVSHLSLQLTRYSGLFYKLRSFATRETLSMLYYGLVYSPIQYGISAWGTASKSNLKKQLGVRLDTILRITGKKDYNTPITELYQHLNFLVLDDVYKLELARIMYLLHNNDLPPVLHSSFTKLTSIHSTILVNLIKTFIFYPVPLNHLLKIF